MHGYAGNPNNYPPEIDEIDDSDAPNALNFNAAIEGLADRTAFLHAITQGDAAENWSPPILPAAKGAASGRPAWDPVNGLWLLTGQSGPPGFAQTQYGVPGSISALAPVSINVAGAPAFAIKAICKDPTDAVTVYLAGIVGNNCVVYTLVGGTYLLAATFTDGVYIDAQLWFFNGTLILATVTTTASSFRISTNKGSTWTQPYLGTNLTRWVLSDNGTQFLALSCTSASTGPHGGAAYVVSSTDGATFTEHAIDSISNLQSGVGLAWGVAGGIGVWVVLSGHTTQREYWTSPDAVNWSLVHTDTVAALDISAIGALFFIAAGDANGFFVAYSSDGCITWNKTQVYTPTTSGPVYFGHAPGQVALVSGGQPATTPNPAQFDLVQFSRIVAPSGITV